MFYHGFDNYMKYGFPEDELNPIQCVGRGRDKQNPHNILINDVLGDYSLTLVDSLDSFAVFGDKQDFEDAVRNVINHVSFDVNSVVQVFELNIRALGGLLSAHSLATDPRFNFTIDWYRNELLDLALDLGERLLLAFQHTKTGIPFPRVNLKHGVPITETHETCTAGAGTLILEFSVLSRLTNDSRFENVARRALFEIWNRRSDLDLVGNVIDIQTGQWIHTASSIGAGIDSFFEYLLKAYVLLGESEYLDVFTLAYSAILRYIRDESGYLYRNVNMFNGGLMSSWVDSLSAFFPGLQVLAGDLESAIKSHFLYYNIWRKYHALPERFNYQLRNVEIGLYPLRPEFIESTYFLYRATRDPFYLEVGEMVINDIEKYARVQCGYASISNVLTKGVDERMESFALSETFKYLYLLFDSDNIFNTLDDNFVFTTEAHILPLPGEYLRPPSTVYRKSRGYDTSTCSVYDKHRSSLIDNILSRSDVDYARELVGLEEHTLPVLDPNGYCEVPQTDPPVLEVSFGEPILEKDRSQQLVKFFDGIVANNLQGLRLELTKRPDRKGYEVTKVHDYRIHPGQIFEIRDPTVKNFWIKQQTYEISILRILLPNNDGHFDYVAAGASFGPKIVQELPVSKLTQVPTSPFGCNTYTENDAKIIKDHILMVKRGGCTFIEKVLRAQEVGAQAVVVISDDNHLFQPSPPAESEGIEIQIPCVLITNESGLELERRLWTSEDRNETTATTNNTRLYKGADEKEIAGNSTTVTTHDVYVTLLPKQLEMATMVKGDGENNDVQLTINGHIIHNIRLNLSGK